MFFEQGGDVNLTGATFLTMVRSEMHKLVHYQGKAWGQLFDLKADAGERANLWDDPVAAEPKRELMEVLMNWHVDSAVATRNARRRIVAPPDAPQMQPN